MSEIFFEIQKGNFTASKINKVNNVNLIIKNQGEIVYNQKGSLFFSKGKFRIALTDLTFLYDGENHYTIVPENKDIPSHPKTTTSCSCTLFTWPRPICEAPVPLLPFQ